MQDEKKRKVPSTGVTPEGVEPVAGETASAQPAATTAAESTEERTDRLTNALVEKTAEAARYQDLYVRERADLENFKKRMQREKADAVRFAAEGLIRDLLPVIDNLERAIEHAAGDGNGASLREGVGMVLKAALDALSRHGVSRIEAVGEPFDPNIHEAVAEVPVADQEPNRVVQQFVPGYRLHERLLRAAQVCVSKRTAG